MNTWHITADQANRELNSSALSISRLDPWINALKMKHSEDFAVRNSYHLMDFGGCTELVYRSILGLLRTKKDVFAWLLIKHRIKVKVRLKKQGVVDSDTDTCPFGCNDQETVAHLTLHEAQQDETYMGPFGHSTR